MDSITEKPDNLESSEESEEEEENEQQETTESQPKDTQELSIVGNASKFDSILGASIDASLEQALMTRSMSSATMKDFIHNTSTSYRHFSSFNATGEERERELLRGMSAGSFRFLSMMEIVIFILLDNSRIPWVI